jgi:hypothetical protein
VSRIKSQFFYGFNILQTNNKLDFNEGSGELQATLKVGQYSLETFADECARVMNAVGTQSYTATVNRVNRKITFSALASFTLLAGTGSRKGEGPWQLLGQSVDKTGGSIEMDGPAGSVFVPQFSLQSYIAPDNWREYLKAVVNESAFGNVEVVRFGQIRFTQFNVRLQTNQTQAAGSPIENDANGVLNLREFMNFCTTKGLVEFMHDRDAPNAYVTLRLESTEDSSKGVGFQLKEQYDRGLPNFFDSGLLKWRVIE